MKCVCDALCLSGASAAALDDWAQGMTRLVGEHFPSMVVGSLKTAHLPRLRTPPLTNLLATLAAADFALGLASVAMEVVPELARRASFRDACMRGERVVLRAWQKLGLYNQAATWARKGLAQQTAGLLTGPSVEFSQPIAGIEGAVHRKLADRRSSLVPSFSSTLV